jgi:hypothetical protein
MICLPQISHREPTERNTTLNHVLWVSPEWRNLVAAFQQDQILILASYTNSISFDKSYEVPRILETLVRQDKPG